MRRPVRALLAVALVAVMSACSSTGSGGVPTAPSNGVATEPVPTSSVAPPGAAELPVGSSTREVTVAGEVRTFLVYRPAGLDDPAPLVLVLHGYGGTAEAVESTFGWDDVADREGIVVAYPQGVDRSFNAGACCGAAMERDVDDVAAALAVVDDVAGAIAIDATRMYVTGFSNGGAMTYRLACETDLFAAFGPVSGGQVVGCADREPTSILHIHGDEDPAVPMEGDPDGMGHSDIEENLASWRALEQCDPPVESTSDGFRSSSAACTDGRDVDLIVIDGGTHEWPNSPGGLHAAETLWEFFAAHPRGTPGTTATP